MKILSIVTSVIYESGARNGRVAQLEEHLPYTQAVAGSSPVPITERRHMQIEYEVVYSDFVRRMNALLIRAKAGDAGVMDDYWAIKADLDTRVASGFVDWESDISHHLKMLKYWCEKFEPTPP